MPESLIPLDAPLNGVGKALVGGVLALGKAMGATVPDAALDADTTGAQAIAMLQDVVGDLFPACDPEPSGSGHRSTPRPISSDDAAHGDLDAVPAPDCRRRAT